MQILFVNYMHKRQEETNVKTHYDSFGINPMKMCLKHKTRMKVDYKILNIRNAFLSSNCDLHSLKVLQNN